MILRLKDGMDTAEPSTNSISALNLFRLSSYLEDPSYATLATQTLSAFSTEIQQHPFLFSSMLAAVVAGRIGMRSIVLTGSTEETAQAVLKVRARVRPNTTVVRLGDGARWGWLKERNVLVREMEAEKVRVQICEGGACREVLDMEEVGRALSWDEDGVEGAAV